MGEKFGPDWLLWNYKVDRTGLFTALDDPNRGIALVETGLGIDPQGFVSRFAAWADIKNADGSTHWGTRNRPHYLEESDSQEEAEVASALIREYELVFGGIEKIVDHVVGRYAKDADYLVQPYRLLQASNVWGDPVSHKDNAVVTAWLGATYPGFRLRIPGRGERRLSALPPHHVLLIRQKEWPKLFPKEAHPGGVRHRVVRPEHTPQGQRRAVGLDFFELTI